MEITIDSAVQVWSYLHSILIYADVSREVFKVIKSQFFSWSKLSWNVYGFWIFAADCTTLRYNTRTTTSRITIYWLWNAKLPNTRILTVQDDGCFGLSNYKFLTRRAINCSVWVLLIILLPVSVISFIPSTRMVNSKILWRNAWNRRKVYKANCCQNWY